MKAVCRIIHQGKNAPVAPSISHNILTSNLNYIYSSQKPALKGDREGGGETQFLGET